MGVVVLDAHELGAATPQVHGVLGGKVLGVQVMGDHFGVHVEQAAEVPYALGERSQRLVVLQVADVMGHESAPSLGQAEGVLQLGAARQHRAEQLPGQRAAVGARTPGTAAAGWRRLAASA